MKMEKAKQITSTERKYLQPQGVHNIKVLQTPQGAQKWNSPMPHCSTPWSTNLQIVKALQKRLCHLVDGLTVSNEH